MDFSNKLEDYIPHEKAFQTKTGYCHILPDKIVLTRNGVIGEVAEIDTRNKIWQSLLIQFVMVIVLGYHAYEKFSSGSLAIAIGVTIPGLALLCSLVISLRYSSTPLIERKKIKKVTFNKGLQGFIRSHFKITFNENGKTIHRLIPLPGMLQNGNQATQKALKIMQEEGLV